MLSAAPLDQSNGVFRRGAAEPCETKVLWSCWSSPRSHSSVAIRLVLAGNNRAALHPRTHALHQQEYPREVGLPDTAKGPNRDRLPCKLFHCASTLVRFRLAEEMAIIVDCTHRLASARRV